MGKYHDYYDILNLGKKNYEEDVQKVIRACSGYAWQENMKIETKLKYRVLEIGCGTGNHTLHFCKVAKEVIACDTDPIMLHKAKLKLGESTRFYNDITNVNEDEFDIAAMMWNVLNYFPTIEVINHIFENVYARLRIGGHFIFDAWNGVAVLRDLPKTATYEINHEGYHIIHNLTGQTSLMDLRTTIMNEMRVYINDIMVDHFAHEVLHYIWTAKVINDLLHQNGFNVNTAKITDYRTPATEEDWKLVYIAKK